MEIFGIEYRKMDTDKCLRVDTEGATLGLSLEYLEDFKAGKKVLASPMGSFRDFFAGELILVSKVGGRLVIHMDEMKGSVRTFIPEIGKIYVDQSIELDKPLKESLYEALTRLCQGYRRDEVKLEAK